MPYSVEGLSDIQEGNICFFLLDSQRSDGLLEHKCCVHASHSGFEATL